MASSSRSGLRLGRDLEAGSSVIAPRRSSSSSTGSKTNEHFGQRTRFPEADALLSGLIVSTKAGQALQTARIVLGPQNLLLQAGMKGIAEKPAAMPSTQWVEAQPRVRY